ncbi:MAG: Holliday junction resolvase RuvX [Acholeplasmatales bacterium]|nr:Holliday junction resolvase RuvX [Acholeplasmatales bacterium]
MKYLGLDLGSRTLGLAISDALGMFARAYETLRFEDDDYDYAINETINICKKEGINEIVLGNPKHMNGDEGIRSQISYDFKKKIEEKSDIKVHLIDERLTTVRVDKAMIMGNMSRQKRHQKKDEMAAVVILQDFLDSKH